LAFVDGLFQLLPRQGSIAEFNRFREGDIGFVPHRLARLPRLARLLVGLLGFALRGLAFGLPRQDDSMSAQYDPTDS
jgi:hypothetical protein